MNEHSITFFNGMTHYVMCYDFPQAIIEGVRINKEKEYHSSIKYIMDDDNTLIKNIDESRLTFSYGDAKTILCK
jgi:hypothetical protein